MIRSADVMATYTSWVQSYEDELTALDQASGDGDFGENLRSGLALVSAQLEADRAEHVMVVAGAVFLDRVGGTSGPLFGLLFQAIGGAVSTVGDGREAWTAGIREGLAAIQRVGEAEVGDRTMVDALAPGVAALTAGDSLAAVARSAYAGAESTASIVARRGRASYVGERARGFPDPGAVGAALLFGALAAGDGADDAPGPEDLVRGWPRTAP